MKKTLRFCVLSMLMMVCGMMQASTVTFDFDNDYQKLFPQLAGVSSSSGSTDGDITEAVKATVDGVTLTVSAAEEGKTTNRIWSGSPRLRVYSGTITIAAPGHKITALAISQGKWNNGNTASTGTLTSTAWSGEAEELVITIAGNSQFKSITVELDGEGKTDEPSIGDDQPAEVVKATCAEIIAGQDGTVYEVTGTCTKVANTTYGNWYLTDETGEVYIYGTLDAEGNTKNFSSLGIQVGDKVTVRGPKKTYNETVELVDVTVLNIEKSETPAPSEFQGGDTPETALSVSAVLEGMVDFQDNQTTTGSYYVKGYIISITEVSASYGNATFVIADANNADALEQLTVFRAKGLENKAVTEGLIKEGDQVVLYGQLQLYVKGEEIKEELVNGYIYSLNGKTTTEEKPYEQVGNGSKENPYTVEDIKHMTVSDSNAAEGQEKVWVKGYIVGALNSSGSAYDAAAATNIALNSNINTPENASETVPVQLPAGDLRSALNVVDNPSHLGKEVIVYGHILKYMGKAGVKNVTDFVLDGKEFDAVESVKAADTQDAQVFNLAGQRVVKAQKGLYIVGGKKVVK